MEARNRDVLDKMLVLCSSTKNGLGKVRVGPSSSARIQEGLEQATQVTSPYLAWLSHPPTDIGTILRPGACIPTDKIWDWDCTY